MTATDSRNKTASGGAKRKTKKKPEVGPDPVEPRGLTEKQALFIQEYLIDLNATKAAERAGYSKETARQIGAENLAKPVIRQAIQDAMDLRVKRTQITQDRVLTELAKIGFSDVRQIFTESGRLRDIASLEDEISAAIQSVEVVTRAAGKNEDGTTDIEHVHKIRLCDKKAALELLGKNLKLFNDRVEHTGKDGGPIETSDFSEREFARRVAFLLSKAATSKDHD